MVGLRGDAWAAEDCAVAQGERVPGPSGEGESGKLRRLADDSLQELPKKKVAVTQERSKVIRETEENPFGDDEEEEARNAAQQRARAGSSSAAAAATTATPSTTTTTKTHKSSSSTGSSFFGSSSKDKKKDKSKSSKRKPFNLEAEKEQMKSVIADATITSTNLMNTLQTINRETERISENQQAVERFEACKQLRRRVLRYVCASLP